MSLTPAPTPIDELVETFETVASPVDVPADPPLVLGARTTTPMQDITDALDRLLAALEYRTAGHDTDPQTLTITINPVDATTGTTMHVVATIEATR